MMKAIGKYVLAPGAGVAMLAGFGIFDLKPGAGGGSSAGLTTVDAAGGQILSALEGPLAVAQRIATAGAGMMDIDASQLPAFMTGGAAGPVAETPGGGAPTAVRKTVSVAGDPAAGVMPSGGAWKSSRPPATE